MEITEPNIGWKEALGSETDTPPISNGHTFYVNEKPCTVVALENGMKGQFESWVQAGAMKLIADTQAKFGPDAANQMRSTYMRDFSSRDYNYDGSACIDARTKPAGLAYLLFLLMRPVPSQAKMTPDQAMELLQAAPQDCLLAISWAVGKNSQSSTGKPSSSRKTMTE